MAFTKFPKGVQSFVVPKNATVCSASTLTAAANTVYYFTATCVVTLPAIAQGDSFTFINAGKDGQVQISLSPNASDGIALGGSFVDNKDLINTLATSKEGDFVTLAAGDQVIYWFPTAIQGVWAKEA